MLSGVDYSEIILSQVTVFLTYAWFLRLRVRNTMICALNIWNKKTDTYIHLTEQTQRYIEYSGISWSERWRAVPIYFSFPNRIIPTTQTFPRKKYLVRRAWTNHESIEILMTNPWSEFRFKNRDKKETDKNWHFFIVCLSIMSRIAFSMWLVNLKSDTVDCFFFYRSSIKNITNWKKSVHFAFSILLDLTMVLDVWWSELINLEIFIRCKSREVNSF